MCFDFKLTQTIEWLNFCDSRHLPTERVQETTFNSDFFCSGPIMQTAGRIYLTFSQLLSQLEIMDDSPSAVIKIEKRFFLSQENHRAGNRTRNAVSAQLAWSGAQLLRAIKLFGQGCPAISHGGNGVWLQSGCMSADIHLLDSP